MPNVRASSGMTGTNRSPMTGSFIRSLRIRTKAIVVATDCLPEPRRKPSKSASGGCGSGLGRAPRRVLPRVVVRRQPRLKRRVGDRQVEPVAELLELVVGELLHLVGRVAGLEVLAQRPARDRVGQDHGRLADVLAGGLE